ncbi:hypothetical protein NUU61_002818 [Penicillium alfredii]|uniref:Secreted protein n=1 Tax=Penicillium alfredii TaxID=1506179 RepID=A0A9W9FS74_9EURO|nr:uncharacterized protein NUU61_002818 [Penicillium alfredii]KAJ5105471.1 hypothetical protein NUU61_002818 [Penicillium alfredii]
MKLTATVALVALAISAEASASDSSAAIVDKRSNWKNSFDGQRVYRTPGCERDDGASYAYVWSRCVPSTEPNGKDELASAGDWLEGQPWCWLVDKNSNWQKCGGSHEIVDWAIQESACATKEMSPRGGCSKDTY